MHSIDYKMNFFGTFGLFFVLMIGFGISSAHAEVDPLSEIMFFQSGELHTEKNNFIISDKFDIREFFNGNIIRVSGQTIEGFPYITYSKITNDQINTFGNIFINGEFVNLSFIEEENTIKDFEIKNDDLEIVTQYTQRVHSKQVIFIDVKIFENEQNNYINFNQNYGYITNTDIKVEITNEENLEVFSSNGITNENGLYQTEYLIPDNSRIETLTITINVDNDNSSSSKILQVFTLGNLSNNG